MEALMKKFMKVAAATVLALGAATFATAPAQAAVHVGIVAPGPVVYPARYYGPPPCYPYAPYACARPIYYGPGYYRTWRPVWPAWHPARHYRRW